MPKVYKIVLTVKVLSDITLLSERMVYLHIKEGRVDMDNPLDVMQWALTERDRNLRILAAKAGGDCL